MKLISWNVNGIRASLKKGFCDIIRELDPDILCIQETKAPAAAVDIDLPGYFQYWNHAEKKGYSGTLTFSKIKPLHVTLGLDIKEHDQEGRVITAEYADFFLVNVYVPNAQRGLLRLAYRQKWDADFLQHLKNLEKTKPVIFAGDMNVAHKEIDLTNPKSNTRTHGFTVEERQGFTNFIEAGFIDTFREFNQEGGHYSWWSPMQNCRPRNIGWRIDYFAISSSLRPCLKEARILPEVMGSDHCPVTCIIT